ncbi:hypothetical protein AAVH_21256 [Aphelenchoides avenae]|nr:hypothetical protein AAVH_21256 [Aphelenchus avenae]
MRHRHSDRTKIGEKRKRSENTSTAGQTSAQCVKDEPASAEDLNEEDVNELLNFIDCMEGNNCVPQQEPERAEDNENPQLPNDGNGMKEDEPEIKQSANASTAGQAPATRVKDEPASAEGLNDEDVNQLLGIIKGMEGNNGAPLQEPEHAEGNEDPQFPTDQTVVKAEAPDVEVQDQQWTTPYCREPTGFHDLRRLSEALRHPGGRIEAKIFEKSAENVNRSENWVVAVDDDMKLPLVNGCVMAETCADI